MARKGITVEKGRDEEDGKMGRLMKGREKNIDGKGVGRGTEDELGDFLIPFPFLFYVIFFF